MDDAIAEVLLIGGRSGAGKTTVGWEVAARLRAATVPHAIIDGDFMGQVYPVPDDLPGLVERNLAAVWANYAALGCERLVYVNTLSVLPSAAGMFRRALGRRVRLVPVLLTASDATVATRLAQRELGSELTDGLAASAERNRVLTQLADVVRVATDGRSVVDIAREVVVASGWVPDFRRL
ncbi:MAG: hypothetical protein WBA97_02505 [Actinophytocola sp.]|uniref:hypothetical protein n=1 Tax=Actinophytocola sp. TaxID=1872138 RepID=UPI003C742EF3